MVEALLSLLGVAGPQGPASDTPSCWLGRVVLTLPIPARLVQDEALHDLHDGVVAQVVQELLEQREATVVDVRHDLPRGNQGQEHRSRSEGGITRIHTDTLSGGTISYLRGRRF